MLTLMTHTDRDDYWRGHYHYVDAADHANPGSSVFNTIYVIHNFNAISLTMSFLYYVKVTIFTDSL